MTTIDVIQKPGIGLVEHRVRSLGDTDAHLIRDADDEAVARFTGHAAVFDSRAAIGNPLRWGWYEQIARGAFTKTLNEGDARFLVDHDSSMLVARVSAEDLRLSEDGTGLAVDADLDTELSYVRDLVRNLDKRRITGMSFGFYVVKDDWTIEEVETSDGNTAEVEVRTIQEVRLLEVSAVTFPAYEDTDAGLRAMCEQVRSAHHPESLPDSQSGKPEPVEATRDGVDEPVEATHRRNVNVRRMRMVGMSAIHPEKLVKGNTDD